MKTLLELEPTVQLSVEELQLLSVAYKNTVGDMRATRRVYSSILGNLPPLSPIMLSDGQIC